MVSVRNVDPNSADLADRDEAFEKSDIEVSIVMPCLDEADTLGVCIEKAKRALYERKIVGEIIVADNGSRDKSQTIAVNMGARLVNVKAKGYGNALMGGIAAARGKYIIMGDADNSYDFLELPKFVEKLRAGFELVQGCRLPSGGGHIMPNAMPFLHRRFGNPVFSRMVRRMFRSSVKDVYCGLRGFTRKLYDHLNLRCTGMEFATEMIIKASICGAKITEVPITLHPDGRKSHPPHLKTFRDGWRTLRFFLLSSPRWLFFYPGVVLVLLGCLGYGIAIPGFTISGIRLDAHTLLYSSLAILLGYQAIIFAVFAKTFAIIEGLFPDDPRITHFYKIVNLEKGLLIGTGALISGLILLLIIFNHWRLADFGDLYYPMTMRWAIPGVTLTALGFQTILASFFASILAMGRD